MKKISVLFLLGVIIASIGFSHANAKGVAIGSRSEEVKAIQEILKTDSDVYPEGYVTGYYGSLTEKAVRKLQKKCGIPETGVVDDATEKCIYPIDYKIKVVAPNGGEVWDRNTIQAIKWEVTGPEIIILQDSKPFWSKASIDLFRRTTITCPVCPAGLVCAPCASEVPVFVKHLATVSLFDGSYSWQISSDILNSKDYIVRVSAGKNIVPLWRSEKNGEDLPPSAEIWPIPSQPGYFGWDESDGTFEIIGNTTQCPTCPVCQPDTQKIQGVIAILQNLITELQKAIALLK